MKRTLTIFLLVLVKGNILNAQDFEFNLNIAPNLAILPDFTNEIYIAIDPVGSLVNIERPINPYNFESYRTYTYVQKPSPKTGYNIELELGFRLNDKFKLIFIGGLNSMKYSYETTINIEGVSSDNLNDLDSDYGNPSFLYLNLKPINLSTKLISNKLNILFGPAFNYLVKNNYSKVVIEYSNNYIYESSTYKEIDKVYFERTGELNKLFFGLNSRIRYRISRNLSLFFSAQYYFNPIFGKKDDFRVRYDDAYIGKEFKPLFIQSGLSFDLLSLGSKFRK